MTASSSTLPLFASPLPPELVPTNRHIDLRALTYEAVLEESNHTNNDNTNGSNSKPTPIPTAAGQLLKTMECSICQAVLVEPRSTRCGHTFCAACLREALRIDPRCPVDRTPLRWDRPGDVRAAPLVVASVVDELIVACPNASAGCTYRCARGLVECHVWHNCRYTEVSCPGCGVPTERRFFEKDKNVNVAEDKCPHTLEACDECGTEVPRYSLPKHVCEPIVAATDSGVEDKSTVLGCIDCPLCNMETTKSKLQTHLAETCLEATVNCKAGASLGCRWTGKRQAYTSRHRKNCHFVVLGPTLRRQNERLNRLQEENRQLNYKVDRMAMALASAGLDCEGNPRENESITLHPIPGEGEEVSSANENDNVNSAASTSAYPQNNINLTESDFMSLFMEGDRFRVELERVRRSMEMRMVQEGFRTSEELVSLRAMINGLRQQVNFLWTERWVNNNNNNFLHQYMHQNQHQNNLQRPTETAVGPEENTDRLASIPRRLSDISRQNVKL